MIDIVISLWNRIFAPKDWYVYGDITTQEFRAKRWRNGRWEFRDATPDEMTEMVYWQAQR